jgi:hypothetical protein
MKKLTITFAALAMLTAAAFAQSESCPDKDCQGTCPFAAATDQLPKMTFKVGDESTCCSASAEALAKEHGADILFVVAENDYSDKNEAMAALAGVTEEFVSKFTTPSTCSVSGTTKLAGHTMKCAESAGKLAEEMKSAMDQVQLVYKVGDESCECPNKAKSLAEEKGETMQFVVGEESTCCSVDARVKLAHAKFRAALEAFARANAPSEETKTAQADL